jgi:hypothetical protein
LSLLKRRGVPNRFQPSRLQRLEIVLGAPVGFGTRKDRDVAGSVVVLVLDAPSAPLMAVRKEPNISMEILLDSAALNALVLGRVNGGDELLEGPGTIYHGTTTLSDGT